MKLNYIILSVLIFSQTAYAEDGVAFDEAAVLNVLDRSIAEQHVFATCSALDGDNRNFLKKNWQQWVNEVRSKLRGTKPSVIFIAKLEYKLRNTILLDETMSLASAMEFCDKNKDAFRKQFLLDYIMLPIEVSKIIYAPTKK